MPLLKHNNIHTLHFKQKAFIVVVQYLPSGGDGEALRDWFLNGVARVIGNGHSTQFWHDPWCGPILLRDRFRRLFQLSLQEDGRVGDLGVWEGSV